MATLIATLKDQDLREPKVRAIRRIKVVKILAP